MMRVKPNILHPKFDMNLFFFLIVQKDLHKVVVPNPNIAIIWTLNLECYVVNCESNICRLDWNFCIIINCLDLYISMLLRCIWFFSLQNLKLVYKLESLSLNTRQGSWFVHFTALAPKPIKLLMWHKHTLHLSMRNVKPTMVIIRYSIQQYIFCIL